MILATYNEAENLTQLIEALEGIGEDLQLVVVDDNSPDGTGLIAQQLSSKFGNITIVNRPFKLGLGSALRIGMSVALDVGVRYVMTMDADLSHDPADVPRLLSDIKTGSADMVQGSRYAPGGRRSRLERQTPAVEPVSQPSIPLGSRDTLRVHYKLPGIFPRGCIGGLIQGQGRRL